MLHLETRHIQGIIRVLFEDCRSEEEIQSVKIDIENAVELETENRKFDLKNGGKI